MKYEELLNTWLKETVIKMNLCPFAAKPFKEGKIRINICESKSFKEVFDHFANEIELLEKSDQIETTLLGVPNLTEDFYDFNDFIHEINNQMSQSGYDEVYQVVGFHPQFQFAGLEKDDPANKVNQSPIAMIHILRAQSITDLNLTPEEGMAISEANAKKFS